MSGEKKVLSGKVGHTPGPWKYGAERHAIPDAPILCYVVVDTNSNKYIASVTKDNEANAALIAAAPELLEACIQMKKCLIADVPNPSATREFELMEEAISKAEA